MITESVLHEVDYKIAPFDGMTSAGGTFGAGTVFEITPQGTLTTLWQFNIANGYAVTRQNRLDGTAGR